MHLPAIARPLSSLADLAVLIRQRVTDTLLGRPDLPARVPEQPDTVVVAAAAPFAATSFARARLLRQMHACGLLSPAETEQAERLFGVAQSG